MSRNIKLSGFLLIAIIFTVIGIQSCDEASSIDIPDVSHISPSVNWVSVEKLIRDLDTSNLETDYISLSADYPEFFDIYNNNILPVGKSVSGGVNLTEIEKLFKDTIFTDLTAQTKETFDQEKLKEEYITACKYLSYYLPEIDAPDLYSFISVYNYQLFLFGEKENKIGIGLDMFMNELVPYKKLDPKNPNFSAYLSRTYNQDHIIPKVITTLLEEELRLPAGNNFLDKVINQGKLLYIKKQILPMHHDTLIHEHSLEQWQWLENNEKEIFSFFKDEALFYETDHRKYMRYVAPGPTSPGMPSASPGRTGNFIGFKIVQAYIAKHKELSMQDLININASDMLQQSRYKPPR